MWAQPQLRRANASPSDNPQPVFRKSSGTESDEDDDDGLTHSVYVMYHGTSHANIESILRNGFRLDRSRNGMLGVGIYASTDPQKTLNYGNVTLKLLVYTGKVNTKQDPVFEVWIKYFRMNTRK